MIKLLWGIYGNSYLEPALPQFHGQIFQDSSPVENRKSINRTFERYRVDASITFLFGFSDNFLYTTLPFFDKCLAGD
jgi:hypothetical protein